MPQNIHKIYITGSSSGIGQALAEHALEKGHRVVGISRRQSIHHANYTHVKADLADLDQFVRFSFDDEQGIDSFVLVNNAGTLGDVKPVDKLDPEKIDHAYRLNVSAPTILTRLFLQNTARCEKPRTVLNISSGAGSYPIPSWSTYCASKAAIDMFTRVLRIDHPDVHSFAIGPGIVDTEMQGEIRRQPEEFFPDLQRFQDYKKAGELADPRDVARKFLHVLDHPQDYAEEACFSLRDVSLPGE